MTVSAEECRALDRSARLEWLEPNGRGGFASGTVAGPNTRRYHALLLVARKPPTDRVVLVNHLEETLTVGDLAIPLSANYYPGTVYPEGFLRCTGFTHEPWPTWTYEFGDMVVQRECCCLHGRDIVVVRWTRLDRLKTASVLTVRPMLTGRDYHALHQENGTLDPRADAGDGRVSWQPYRDLPTVTAWHTGAYRHAPDWYRRIRYPIEQARGLDHLEDWWSPGEVTVELTGKRAAQVVFTGETVEVDELDEAIRAEQRRRSQDRRGDDAGRRRGPGSRADGVAPPASVRADPLVLALWRATGAYLADRGPGKTVIAGYPWFADWGRDTFISLPGLCLVTGRFDAARQVIEAFAPHVSEGMVPNRFPDAGDRPEYNTIDGSLWFVHAVGRYWDYTADAVTVEKLAWPAVRAVLDGYRRGTRYGIRVDDDGLVTGGETGAQLTWMDAKVGDWVVTPRRGKPVEIQALWVRALTVGEALARLVGDKAAAAACAVDRAKAVESFRQRFWYEPGGYCYDVVDGESDDGMGLDATLRPNQLYAVSLCDDLLDGACARRVVEAVQERLLTPVGLRTLPPDHPHYRPRYEGGVVERDGAYHQGTVWPFLLGPFVTAWVKVQSKTSDAGRTARGFLAGLERHLGEACLGHVSEIFDAAPPHEPRGCFAQAWSVAEPLRALLEDVYGVGPANARPSGAAQPSPRKGTRAAR